jgi:alpha-1,6-mannosyltransferase
MHMVRPLYCDLTHAFTPTSGGIRTYIEQKRRYAAEHTEWRSMLVVPGREDRVIRDGESVTYEIAGPRVPGSGYRFIFNLSRVLDALRAERPQVVELGSYYHMPAPALKYRRESANTLGAYYHTDYPTTYVFRALRKAGDRIARKGRSIATRHCRSLHRRMDFTLTGNDDLTRKLTELGVPRVETLPLGVDPVRFSPARRSDSLRTHEFGAATRDVVALYAGRMESEKRFEILLDAIRQTPERAPIRWVLLGDGPLKDDARELARRDRRVVVLPYESDRDRLAGLMASADMYVTAATNETFGLAVVEAQACGLAVAGVRAGAMVDRVPPTAGVLADPDDPQALAAAITGLATSGLLRDLGKQARSIVERTLSWDQTFGRLFEIYGDHVGRAAA